MQNSAHNLSRGMASPPSETLRSNRALKLSATCSRMLLKEERFHDYTSLTAHDVVFSINILKQKGNPTVSQSLQGIQLIQAKNDHEVVVILASRLNRELPLTIASQPIFSASYYATRSFDETTLDPPLGSGPYKVGAFEQGRYISYERVTDYWAGELPVNVG